MRAHFPHDWATNGGKLLNYFNLIAFWFNAKSIKKSSQGLKTLPLRVCMWERGKLVNNLGSFDTHKYLSKACDILNIHVLLPNQQSINYQNDLINPRHISSQWISLVGSLFLIKTVRRSARFLLNSFGNILLPFLFFRLGHDRYEHQYGQCSWYFVLRNY